MYKIIELEINPELSGDTGVFEVAWVEYPAIEQELIYFNEQKFYRAPDEVAKKACQAIKENEKRNNKAATQVGKIRGQQLCSQSEISLETIKRMKSYLERAATYNSGDWDDKGTISYNLWGGVPALKWVDSILKDVEKQEQEMADLEDACWEGYEPIGMKEKDGRMVPNCVPIKQGKEIGGEMNILGYNTTNFKLCPGAQNLFSTILENELDEDTKGMVRAAAILADLVFGIEYEVVDRGYAYPDELEKATLVVEDFKDIIVEVDNILKTKSNTDFMDGHIKLISEYLTKKDEFVKPQIDENKKEFISRCIPVLISEGKSSEDAAGACYGMWDNREFAPTKVSFDWDDTLSTKNGKKLLEQELSRGSIIYIISARNTTTQEMIDLANEYGFPARNIYTEGSNIEKIKKVKELGIKRHYDNNFNVVQELGPIGVQFDYETGGLPPFVNYPDEEDKKDMLIEPELFNEDCGCMKAYPWDECISDQLENGYDKETAEKICGKIKSINNSSDDGLWDEYSIEDILMKIEFDDLANRLSPQQFRAVTDPVLRGFTEQEVYDMEHRNPVNYFRYDTKITAGPPDRDFCTSIEGRYFRRAQIDALRNTNLEFGHEGQPYSKWLFKGGPLCKHAFRKFLFQENNKADLGWADGGGGTAPRELVGKGFYPGTPKYEANLSKQSVGYIDDLECAFGDLCKIEFNKDTNQLFSAKEEERMIYTPLMIPNILIPRWDEVSQEKYFVKFTPETILNIRDKFMSELRNRKTNLEHSDRKFEDVVMVETWIVQGEKDKAYELGFTQEQIPFGSWMGAYKVLETKEGDFVWNNYIKSKKVRGASVEGNFLLNFSVEKRDEYLLEQIINILNKIID